MVFFDFQLTYQDSFGYSAETRHHIAFYEVISFLRITF